MEGSLSDNIIKARSTKLHENVIYAFKDKQFIKEIETEATKPGLTMGERIEIINKRAGRG